MELEKKDLEKLVLESMKLRLHKKEVEEGVLGGIKGVAGGVKKMYQLGSVKSDIEDALKKIEGDKDKLEKLKTRADSLDLQSSDKALYDKLTAAISGTPSTAAAPSISPATTPSVASTTRTSGGGLPSSSAASPTGGGSFTATSPSAGTTRRRVSSTGVFEPSSAATASAGTPSPAEIPAPVSTKTPDVKSPEKAKEVEPKNGEERPEKAVLPPFPPEKDKTKPEKKPIDTSATTGQRPQNKRAFQTALDTVYNNFEKAAKDEKVKEAANDIYSKFTEQISKFSVRTGKITEADKKEIKLSSIVKNAISGLDDVQKKEIAGFINDLSQLTINFGYGNEFAKDYVSVIVPAPEPDPEAPPKDGKKGVESTTTPAPEIAASTPPEDAPAKEEPKNLGFEPATPENSGPSALNKQVLKTIGIDDEELLKYLSDIMDSHEDEYEIVENKASYVKKLIIQEAKKVIELTKWMKEKGYEASKIKSVLQMLQKFPKGTGEKVLVTFGGEAAGMLNPAEQTPEASPEPETGAGEQQEPPIPAALAADDVTVTQKTVQKGKAEKTAGKAKAGGTTIKVIRSNKPNAVAVVAPVENPTEKDKAAIVAAASELGADAKEVEADIGQGPAAVIAPANKAAAEKLKDPEVALQIAQGEEASSSSDQPVSAPAPKAQTGQTKQEAEKKARGKLEKLSLNPRDKKQIGIRLTSAKTAEEVENIISGAETQAKESPFKPTTISAPAAAPQESELDKAKRIAIELANQLYSKTDAPDIIDGIKDSESVEDIEIMFSEQSRKGDAKKSFKQSLKSGAAEIVGGKQGSSEEEKRKEQERKEAEAASREAEKEKKVKEKEQRKLVNIEAGKEPSDKKTKEPSEKEKVAAAEREKEIAIARERGRKSMGLDVQKESIESEPMFILKEGQFVLNKRFYKI